MEASKSDSQPKVKSASKTSNSPSTKQPKEKDAKDKGRQVYNIQNIYPIN